MILAVRIAGRLLVERQAGISFLSFNLSESCLEPQKIVRPYRYVDSGNTLLNRGTVAALQSIIKRQSSPFFKRIALKY